MGTSLLSAKPQSDSGAFENIKNLENMCKRCTSFTPVQCISLCRLYRIKNELRNLRNIMNNPSYTTDFFNAIKNSTRLHIFQIIVNSSRCTLGKIQQELKSINIKQSQYTISEEHIQPLLTIGLVTESTGKYNATLFGTGIHELLGGFDSFIKQLPPQSECHEETLIQLLLLGPKTCEEIKQVLPTTIMSRTIKRISTAGLINIPTDRNYIFFHKSRRDPTLEILTDSEMKTYQTIPTRGISADKLAKLVNLSQRRTYAYIRRLKGKKLVFTKKIPITYSLTDNGQKLAAILQNLSQKIDETWNFTEYIVQPTDMPYLTNSVTT